MKLPTLNKARVALRTGLGLLRATLVLLLAAVLVLGLSLRAGVARADESMLELGRHLVQLSEAGMGRDARGVLVNGQSLGFRVFTSGQDMATVLNFYEDYCRAGSGSWAQSQEELESLDRSESALPRKLDTSWRALTRRVDDEDMGYVACVRHGVANIQNQELGRRMMAFLETGNLRELGLFHYVAATRIGDETRVVAVWTEGDFYPGRLFPAEGDAPGFDPDGVSPPPSGRRMLSAGEMGEDETLAMYLDCQESVDELAGFYRRDFVRQGWQIVGDEFIDEARIFVVQRGNAMRVLSIAEQEEGLRSVSIATTR